MKRSSACITGGAGRTAGTGRLESHLLSERIALPGQCARLYEACPLAQARPPSYAARTSEMMRSWCDSWMALSEPAKDGTESQFSPQGPVHESARSEREPDHPCLRWRSGRLVTITGPTGQVTTLAYSGTKVQSITDPAGRVTQLEYDAAAASSGCWRGWDGGDVRCL